MRSHSARLLIALIALGPAACVSDNHFRKAPAEVQAKTNMQLAIEYMRLDKMTESRDAIERALKQDGNDAQVQMTAALVYERLNEPGKAERAYSSMYRLGKGDPNIVNVYAGYLCRTGKAEAGEKLFADTAKSPLYQTPEVALTNAGVCVRGTGDLVDAERYFTRALTIRPNYSEALLQLGNIDFDRGDPLAAKGMVERYLAANPATPEILWLGFRADRKLGDNQGAAAYARRVQAEFPNSEQAQMLRSGVSR